MADLADIGNEAAEQHLADALARQRLTSMRPLISAQWCEDCGEAIPHARRLAVQGCQLCIDCQQIREARHV